jgi:hypothetical protein
MFSYLVTVAPGQPDIHEPGRARKEVGMNEPDILSGSFPYRTLAREFLSSESLQTRYPVHYIIPLRDELTPG